MGNQERRPTPTSTASVWPSLSPPAKAGGGGATVAESRCAGLVGAGGGVKIIALEHSVSFNAFHSARLWFRAGRALDQAAGGQKNPSAPAACFARRFPRACRGSLSTARILHSFQANSPSFSRPVLRSSVRQVLSALLAPEARLLFLPPPSPSTPPARVFLIFSAKAHHSPAPLVFTSVFHDGVPPSLFFLLLLFYFFCYKRGSTTFSRFRLA